MTSLFQLISNLPADFNKLLQNYMQRNPASANYRMNEAVDNVIMDALRYAHKAFIGNSLPCKIILLRLIVSTVILSSTVEPVLWDSLNRKRQCAAQTKMKKKHTWFLNVCPYKYYCYGNSNIYACANL